MKRVDLEHVLRAASGITGAEELIVIGSQAVLGQFPSCPPELTVSSEVDLYTLRNEEDALLIDGSIGEGSPFHQTFGYYAHGVGSETATLPDGWMDRLVVVQNANTGTGRGLCLEVHDLAISKLVAGREKDRAFVIGMLLGGLIRSDLLRERLSQTSLSNESSSLVRERLERWLGDASKRNDHEP